MNLYVRWSAAQSYVYLVRDGRVTRADAVRCLGRHLKLAIEHEETGITGGLVCVLSSLWPIEAQDELREAFDRKLVDLGLVDWGFIEASIEDGESGLRKELANCPNTGIDDTIEELRHWASFEERPVTKPTPRPTWKPPPWTTAIASAASRATGPSSQEPLASPVEARRDRVGRNDPCPCGSGKKFKKCCGGRR